MSDGTGGGKAGGEPLMIRCPDCGVSLRKSRLKKHRAKAHPVLIRVEPGLTRRPIGKPRLRSLAHKTTAELEVELRNIEREMSRLSPGFHAQRLEELKPEKRRLSRELKSRKSSGFSNQWERWYGGPGKVRFWRSGS